VSFRRSVIIVELWRPEVGRVVKKSAQFFAFSWKSDPIGENFWNSVPKDSLRNRSTCCFKFREISLTGNRWNRELLTWQKNSPGYPALATARITPKICQGQPRTMYSGCSRFHPNRFTFGGLIVERVNTVETHRKVNPIFGWILALSRINISAQLLSVFTVQG